MRKHRKSVALVMTLAALAVAIPVVCRKVNH